jgi:uncharacterized protein (TIGR02594 family)
VTAFSWVTEARKHIGQKEVPGPGVNAWIRDLWHGLPGGPWFWKHYGQDDSKLPWCGAFCAGVFKRCGIAIPQRYASAVSWLEWGQKINAPAFGCVVVFSRHGGGHVGIVVGKDQRGRLMVLGGNQGDAVSVAPFDRARVTGYRWPPGVPVPSLATLPTVTSSAASSRNEA